MDKNKDLLKTSADMQVQIRDNPLSNQSPHMEKTDLKNATI